MIAGPFLAVCGLLAAAGLLKVWSPGDTVTALRAAGVPVTPASLRVLGGAEVALAAVAAVTGAALAAIGVAVSYLGFAAFVAYALARRLPLRTCGCLGGIDTPPSGWHLGVDLAAAATALVAAQHPPGPAASVLAAQGWGGGIALVGLAAVTAALAGLVLGALPRALALRVRRAP